MGRYRSGRVGPSITPMAWLRTGEKESGGRAENPTPFFYFWVSYVKPFIGDVLWLKINHQVVDFQP